MMIAIDDYDRDVSAMEKMVDTLHWMDIIENPCDFKMNFLGV